MSEEKTSQNAQGARRRHVIFLAVEFVLLVVSALLIAVFLFTAELKGPGGDGAGGAVSADVTPGPVVSQPEAPLSADIPRYRRNALQAEMSELMDGARFRMEHTMLEDIRWIFDAVTPDGFSSNAFYVYLGQRDGVTWGRIVAGYTHERQIFLNDISINVDGTVYDIEVEFNDRESKNLDYIGCVYEYTDIPMWPHIDALRHAGNGEDVRISLGGKGGAHDFRLTYDQIEAVRRMTRLYLILQELESSNF